MGRGPPPPGQRQLVASPDLMRAISNDAPISRRLRVDSRVRLQLMRSIIARPWLSWVFAADIPMDSGSPAPSDQVDL